MLVAGLAPGADVLLLDEPLTGVDLVSADRIRAAVARSGRGCTVIFATHDLAEAEQADVVVLLAGQVVAAGSPAEVITPSIWVLPTAFARSTRRGAARRPRSPSLGLTWIARALGS